jgi:hypothetical protein
VRFVVVWQTHDQAFLSPQQTKRRIANRKKDGVARESGSDFAACLQEGVEPVHQ